jgi:hypothetical protein
MMVVETSFEHLIGQRQKGHYGVIWWNITQGSLQQNFMEHDPKGIPGPCK